MGNLGVILLFPLGLLSGLILGWEEEVKRGALVVASVAAFYLVYDLALGGSMRLGAWILLFGMPPAPLSYARRLNVASP